MHKGFYIKEMEIIGPSLQSAKLTFDKGLNVISGASNTGKSYIFECITYVLGGMEQPKTITEAAGYAEIRLQLNTFDGKEYTLAREFNGNKIRFAETSIDKFTSVETNEVNARKGSTDTDISSFLLNLVGLNGRKLKKDQYNTKRELSFRDLVKFCMINEQQIISEDAPIYSGQVINRTPEESVFKLILSGIDDEELAEIEDPRVVKQKIKGKLELITEQIGQKTIQVDSLQKSLETIEDEQISLKIDEFTKFINDSSRAVLEEEKKRETIWKEIESARIEINHLMELEKRFNLLNKHYDSDLNRLEFINEGKQYFDQLKTVPCPICGNLVEQKIIDKAVEENREIVIEALNSDVKKIRLKQNDLKDTLKNLEGQKVPLGKIIEDKSIEFKKIESDIQNKLKPLVTIHQANLQKFLDMRENKSMILHIIDEIKGLKKDEEFYTYKLSEKVAPALKRSVATDYYNLLQNEVKSILSDWKMDFKTVYFEKESNDLRLDGRLRKEFGKGYRAIVRSAFMVALMKYCLANEKFHPFFLILDSPLTAFKRKDSLEGNNIDLPEGIEESFFTSISEYCSSKEIQVIILENKDPPITLRKNIIFHHFSGNHKVGQYGFYPKNIIK